MAPPPPFYVANQTTSHYLPLKQNRNAVNRQPEGARFGSGQRRRTGSGRRRGSRAGGRGRGRGLMMNGRYMVITNICNNNNNTNYKSVWAKKKVEKKKEEVKHVVVLPLNRDEEKTMVMIKNIPRDHLINMLDGFCMTENAKTMNEGGTPIGIFKECAYDFLYLPIDFRTRRSKGFAFVNFTNATSLWKFFNAFHSTHCDFLERTSWPKKIEIVSAKIQDKEALVKHFAGSTFECETEEYLPVWFDPARDGSGLPVEGTVVGKRRAISHRASTRRGRHHKTLRPRLLE